MALIDSEGRYYKIGKVVGVNDNSTYITVTIECYKNKTTRENKTEFDKALTEPVGITLTEEGLSAFVNSLYAEVKKEDKYKDMTDDI